MSETIADKLVRIAENEVKLYESTFGKGYGQGREKGYKEGYDKAMSERKTEVALNVKISENGNHTFKPNDRETYSSVDVTVDVPDKNGSYAEGYEKGKTDGYNEGLLDGEKPEEVGDFKITENGDYTCTPNEGQVFSSVEVNVNVPIPDGYIQPAGTQEITENGEYNIAEFEKVNVSVKGGGGEETVLTPSLTMTDSCASGDKFFVGKYASSCIAPIPGYNIYGYALNGCTKLKLTGVVLDGSFTSGVANTNIIFVTEFTGIEGGKGVVNAPDIEVTPASWKSDNPPSEYIITVPQMLGVDGVYFSCENGGTPVLEVIEKADYNDGYQDGYNEGFEAGKAEGGGSGGEEPELTPSEGLEFTETYMNVQWTQRYGWTGFGSCTDTEIVVPCATPEGYPVVSVGSRGDNSTTWDKTIWLKGVSKIYLPDTVLEITMSGLLYGDILKYIKFGKYFNFCDTYLYIDGTSPPTDVVLDFSDFALSTPPWLADTSLLTGVIEVRVPSAMVDKFKAATNWSSVADKIVGV